MNSIRLLFSQNFPQISNSEKKKKSFQYREQGNNTCEVDGAKPLRDRRTGYLGPLCSAKHSQDLGGIKGGTWVLERLLDDDNHKTSEL